MSEDYLSKFAKRKLDLPAKCGLVGFILQILLASWQEEIGRLERGLGTRRDHGSPDLVSIDCTTLSKNINCVNTKLAYIAWACESTARILAFLSRVTDRDQKQATIHHEPEDDIYNITNVLLETHDLLRCWNTELQDKTKYLSKRGQALVQTVYNAIAQRDSANNLSLAGMITNLARSSLL
ncbi:hypothetical protein TW65_00996 [Stemphylium lycopersici]|uniref:Uncharacterized protein n=1 Tax=Stemphylium lycopersici TaxID=183478 RepID=A0A364MUN7_STELY|nr:hypothetical protein TW65_00996 [Stemphylium lycopersici]RAR04036.1 hypothetical protein DDE83_007974 [Stemphylium lycopersici]